MPSLPSGAKCSRSVDVTRVLELIQTDEDYIYSRRFDNSLKKLLERHPDGAPDSVIAAVLLVDVATIDTMYDAIVQKLREHMHVEA